MSLRWYAFLCCLGSDMFFIIDHLRSISIFCQKAHHRSLTNESTSFCFTVRVRVRVRVRVQVQDSTRTDSHGLDARFGAFFNPLKCKAPSTMAGDILNDLWIHSRQWWVTWKQTHCLQWTLQISPYCSHCFEFIHGVNTEQTNKGGWKIRNCNMTKFPNTDFL